MSDDRIAKLSQRFQTHAGGRRPAVTRSRERQSLYLDTGVKKRLDASYKEISHDLHPASVSKSVFLETLISYALDHVDELKAAILQASEEEAQATN